jgi:LemA protein
MSIGVIIILIIVVIAIYMIVIYNKFASLRAGIDAAWSDIEVQLKKRYNLIPALVEVVTGYKNYELDTLKQVIEARRAGLNAKSVDEQSKANSTLGAALSNFFALAESYPELKADKNFRNLQDELSNIEESIANARRYYNAIVRDYNASLESFPDVLIAKRFNYKPRDYFELDDSEKEAVKKMPDINL